MSRKQAHQPIGRIELLNWMNEFLDSEYAKVEQACDGVAYAQIIDCACDMRLPLHKFSFAARNEDDYARNLTLLQQEFKKLGIDHPVPVDRLAKGKLQDNNEFLLWCFRYLHNCKEPPHYYPAVARRQEALHKQIRMRGRGLPPPTIKTELVNGIDLDAPMPPASVPTSRSQPPEADAGSEASRYDPGQYQRQLSRDATDEFDADDAEVLELAHELAEELRGARVRQTKRRADVDVLMRERNSLWKQLRTIEELLASDGFQSFSSVDVIGKILFEQDPRLA
ncbi:Microtubule-associated protein RP/EB family member 1A [Diplonema papillatum]|nr:Microtubule-associated protein RP/EB family member 1A [Diplonema papillatum]